MRAFLIFGPWFLLLGSCSAPPKPPTVDEAARRPANSQQTIDLQACRIERYNRGLRLQEVERELEASAQSLQLMAKREQLLAGARQPDLTPTPLPSTSKAPSPRSDANLIFTVHFDYGSATPRIAEDEVQRLANAARRAPWIVIRGRTDGQIETAPEARIARARATAMRDLLMSSGVDPARIRWTYQPTGDHAADNGTASGQAVNRRAEIELYTVAPTPWPARPKPARVDGASGG